MIGPWPNCGRSARKVAAGRTRLQRLQENPIGHHARRRLEPHPSREVALIAVEIMQHRRAVEHPAITARQCQAFFPRLVRNRPGVEHPMNGDHVGPVRLGRQPRRGQDDRVPHAVQVDQLNAIQPWPDVPVRLGGKKIFLAVQRREILQPHPIHRRDRLEHRLDPLLGVGKLIRDDLHVATQRGLGGGQAGGDRRRAARGGIQRRNHVQNPHARFIVGQWAGFGKNFASSSRFVDEPACMIYRKWS